ncbi:anaerobic sulfatase maturase [Boudabousia liubingyangii]|uniref:Anaerobic sulfatase maturase n=1 Tax=Boudabousia liubingyangii TaxID=1921764 RepID=A0A1Q5PPW2_9ACTO|nr:anaerobic sulfatase maturase [Boudabousia liubingyangii]
MKGPGTLAETQTEQSPLVRTRLPFSVVAKPTGAACNLDCSYCFFLSKELLYDAKRQLMEESSLDTYIKEWAAAQPNGEVTLLWQGGEPTMRGLDFFRKAVELGEKYARPGQKIVHAIQTNGTLINEEWAQFLAENDFLVGVSMDGPEALHDAYRVNKAGRGTHAMVKRGWDILQAANVRCNVLCTVHHANEKHAAEVYTYFRDELGAQYMQFIPIVERVPAADLAAAEAGWRTDRGEKLLYQQTGDAVTSRSVDPQAYGAFLSEIFDIWRQTDVGKIYVQDFDAALSALFGTHPVCVHAPECGNNFAMEFNGDVYACDHWVEPDYLLGNIAEKPFADLANTPTMREFSKKKSVQLTQQCQKCPVLRFCNGGCPKDRFVLSHDGEPGQNYLCAGYYNFYQHIRPDLIAMARLIRAGQAPAMIMDEGIRNRLRPQARR